LKEEEAYPADPEEGYGWEKLFTEKLCQYYYEDHGLETRVVRFHNVYGPLGTYDGGKEKAPAALCRKIARANDDDEIEVWGDGDQTRSFMHVDDCVEGIHRIAQGNYHEPLNLGRDRMVTINELIDIIAKIAGKNIRKRHDLTKPQGVRGRNSDNEQTVNPAGSRLGRHVPLDRIPDGCQRPQLTCVYTCAADRSLRTLQQNTLSQ
jgi:nucleoside-diphosphate-sugar epimerase